MLAVLKALSCIVGYLPLPLLLWSGRRLGRIAYRLDKRRRKITLRNLEDSFGDEKTPAELRAIAVSVFENMGMNVFELCRIPWLRKGDIAGYVSCEGIENLLEARRKGKGIILITGHFGNWELLAAFYGLIGYPVNIVVRDLDNKVADGFMRWVRTRPGNTIVSKQRSMRNLLRSLSRGGIVGILYDQNVTWSEGVFVNFFGRLACTNKGPSLLAAVSGAVVLPTFIVREGNKHRVIIGKEITLNSSGDKRRDMLENTAKITKVLENIVRQYPGQWFWVHRRWKSRPEDDPNRGTEKAAPVESGY